MTEDEMKTKWCPEAIARIKHSYAGGNEYHAGNRGQDSQEYTRCLGSDCAMWEPEYEEEQKAVPADDEIPEGWHRKSHSNSGTKHTIARYVKTDSGDCGLKSKENGCFYPG